MVEDHQRRLIKEKRIELEEYIGDRLNVYPDSDIKKIQTIYDLSNEQMGRMNVFELSEVLFTLFMELHRDVRGEKRK